MKLSLMMGIVLASVATLMFAMQSQPSTVTRPLDDSWQPIEIVPYEDTTDSAQNNDTDSSDIIPDPSAVERVPPVPKQPIPELIIDPKPISNCFVGGCSSQLCSDSIDLMSTCEWRPEYACYQSATCERQASGQCGWTETAELITCLAAGGEVI